MNANSFLQQSLTPNDTLAIADLGTVLAAPVGTQIWMEIDFDPDSGSVTAASIAAGAGGVEADFRRRLSMRARTRTRS